MLQNHEVPAGTYFSIIMEFQRSLIFDYKTRLSISNDKRTEHFLESFGMYCCCNNVHNVSNLFVNNGLVFHQRSKKSAAN